MAVHWQYNIVMESTIHQPYNISAIFVAYTNFAKMLAQGYSALVNDEATASYFVVTPTNDRYAVNLWNRVSVDALPWCSCEQCAKENICKHIVFVETITNDEAEEMQRRETEREDYLEALENRYR